MKDPTGSEIDLFIYEDRLIEVLPYFLYEVGIYKYWKYGYCIVESKYIQTDVPLVIINPNIYKKDKGNLIEKSVTLLAAPIDFIEEKRLPKYYPKCKK